MTQRVTDDTPHIGRMKEFTTLNRIALSLGEDPRSPELKKFLPIGVLLLGKQKKISLYDACLLGQLKCTAETQTNE